MGSKLAKLKVQVLDLTAKEKQELLVYIQSSLQFSGKNLPKIVIEKADKYASDYLTDAIRRRCVKYGIITLTHSVAVMSYNLKDLPRYPKQNEIARQWLEEHGRPQTEAEKQYLAELAVKALGILLSKGDPEVERTLVVMDYLKNVNRIPEAMNEQFPGYAACGLLSFLIRRPENRKRLRRAK